MKRVHTLGIALFGSVALGCDGGSPNPSQPEGIQSRLVLENFANCDDLEKYIEDTAVRDMRFQLDNYLNNSDSIFRGGVGESTGAPQADSKASGPAAYSTTNTQVAGVDEADFMKNDGTRIFVISGQTLYASKSWPPADMSLVGQLKLEGYPSQMYLEEKKNRVVVFSSVYTKYRNDDPDGTGRGVPCAADNWGCGYSYSNTTKITVVDISNLGAPKVTAEHYLPGSYSNSRRIDSSVRVVLADSFRWPSKVRFYPEVTDPKIWQDKSRLAPIIDRLKADNEVIIRAQSLTDWLPKSKRRLEDGNLVDVSYSCSDFSRSNAPVHLGLLTVATLNLDNRAQDVQRTSIVGQAGEIYASQKALYVANRHWWWWPQLGQSDYTYVHKFDISNPNRATYVASGGVKGHIVDQFSMDEHNGYFRVATTINTRVPDTQNPMNVWGRFETVSKVSVFAENAGRLTLSGDTEALAKGERIFSSRFMGDRAYVVTFRNIDPLFSFDLSDPKNPRKVGELKVPGFSTYLHPVENGKYLLALGVYMPDPAEGPVDWTQRRMKLTLFDVSDLKNPTEKFSQLIGTAYGWSEAAYEHKAFNYFGKVLAIPFSDYKPVRDGNYWDSFVSELRVFSIDTQTGIRSLGAMNMKDMYQRYNDYGWTWYWSPWIRRSVIARDNADNDFVYSVSDAGVRVSALSDLSRPLATVNFSKAGK